MGASAGINVGVDGVSEYVRDLATVTAETKAFQSELKALQSSFDKNASTWSKTQMTSSVLSDSIRSQIEKIALLRQEQSKFAEGSKGWYDYADKINKATDALNKMEQQLKNLPNHVQAIGQDFEKWGSKIENAGKSVSKVGDTLTKSISVPIATGLGAAIKTVADFESEMDKAWSVTGALDSSLSDLEKQTVFDSLSAKAREMGEVTKFTASEAADAIYYMGLAGWDAEAVMSGLSGVMNLAAASGEDLARTSDIVTDSLTAFGQSAEESNHFADVMAATMANSNTTVDLLGESFKYVGAVAGSFGYTIDDVALGLGLMANAGVKGSQAGTGLRQAIQKLTDPTDKTAAVMEKYGVSLFDTSGKALSFGEVIQSLRGKFGGVNADIQEMASILENDGEEALDNYVDSLELTMSDQEKLTAIVQMFGTRALPGVLAMIDASEEDYNKLATAIQTSSDAVEVNGKTFQGAAAAMAEVQLDNFTGQTTILKSKLQELAISFGEQMLPALMNVVDWAQNFVDGLNSMDDSTKEMIIKVGLVAAAVGPILSIGGRVISGIGTIVSGGGKLLQFVGGIGKVIPTVISGFSGFASAIGSAIAAIGPVGIAIAAVVAAIVAAGVLIYKHWDEIKEWAGNLKDTIAEKFEGIKEKVSETWENVKESAATTWENIKQGFADSSFGQAVIQGFDDIKTAAANLKEEFSNSALGNVIRTDLENVQNAFTEAGGGFEGTVAGVAEVIKSKWSLGLDLLNEATGGKLSNTKALVDDTWNAIKESAGTIWGDVKEKVSTGLSGLYETVSAKWGEVKDAFIIGAEWLNVTFSPLIEALGDLFSAIGEYISAYLSAQWEEFAAWITEEWNQLNADAEEIWNGITDVITQAWTAISEFVGPILETIGGAVSEAFGAMLTAVDTKVGEIRTAVQEGFNALVGRVSEPLSRVKNAITTTFNNIKSVVQGVVNSAKNWGRDLVGNIAAGIREKISDAASAIRGVASSIRENIHFSEPDKGPLSDFHTYMPDMMKQIAGGIYQNMGLVDRASEALAAAIMPNVETGRIAGRGNSTTITNGDVVVNVYGAEGQDVRELARIVEQEITFNMNRRSAAFA